jgi:ankyrin repeat protein
VIVFACAVLAGCKSETPAQKTARFAQAVQSLDLEAVRSMLEKDPALAKARDQNGIGMLQLVVGSNSPDIVELLVNNGADARTGGGGGQIPIVAALNGHPPVPREVELLLDHGANPNEKNILGASALMSAAAWGSAECVRALVEKGADVQARGPDYKWSTLHYAVRGANGDVVSYLLEKGAKADVKDSEGRTPLDLATEMSQPVKSEEEQQKEIEELAKKDRNAAFKKAAQMAIEKASGGTARGKDMSSVIAALKKAK